MEPSKAKKKIDGMADPIIERAAAFAYAAHQAADQRRRYTNDLYFVHCHAVAFLVAECESATPDMIAAAYLHDTVEDTNIREADIQFMFNKTVAMYVMWLTDISRPEDGNRVVRKEIDRQHTAHAPREVHTIKLADMIDNTRSIVNYDTNFAKVYIPEKKLLLPVLWDGDTHLTAMANTIVAEAEKTLKARGAI